MSTLTYTITEFDAEKKKVRVEFADGEGWADVQLSDPLPEDQAALELVISQYAPSMAVVDARSNTVVDMSYVSSLIGKEQTCARWQPGSNNAAQEQGTANEPDPEVVAQMKLKQQVEFQTEVADALVAFGILKSNPLTGA